MSLDSPGRSTCGCVRTFVRLRPPSDAQETELFEFAPGLVTLKDPHSDCDHTWQFGSVFLPEHGQPHVFDTVAGPVVDGILEGLSGCIMAYGQTGSGKTYSVFGEGSGDARGMLPRALERLFSENRMLRKGISVSFLEVYLNHVYDLVVEGACPDARSESSASDQESLPQRCRRSSNPRESLHIREGLDGQVVVPGLRRPQVRSLADARSIVEQGLQRRAVAATASNAQSSRSHTVFTLHFAGGPDSPLAGRASELSGGGKSVATSLSFVDLAGSERIAKSKAEGAQFHEAVSINSSLTALGKVVLALAEAAESKTARHVPYRDSKLTRLLSNSLSGASCVSMLACIHPRLQDYDECRNTLAFADRCKNLRLSPVVEGSGGGAGFSNSAAAAKLICDLQAQVKELEDELLRHNAQILLEGSEHFASALGLSRGSVANVPEELHDMLAEAACMEGLSDVDDPAERVRIVVNARAELAAQKAEQERALCRMEQLDLEKERMKEAERIRDEELQALDASCKGLSHDLGQLQLELRETRAKKLADRASGIERLKEDMETAAARIDSTIHSIPEQARLARAAALARQLELDERRNELRGRYLDEVGQRSSEHAKELLELHQSWEVRLEEAKREDRELVDKAYGDLSRDVSEVHKLQEQYVQACERIVGLAAGVENPWDAPPEIRRRLRAGRPREGLSEVADDDTIQEHRFKAKNCPCDVKQLDGDENQVEETIRDLPADVLCSLCLQLRDRSRLAFSWDGEHAAIQEDALKALDDEATVQYVEQLRQLRDEGRAALAGSEERSRLLRIELENRRAAERPPSANRSFRPPSSIPSAVVTTRTGSSLRRSTATTSTMTRSRRTVASSSRPATAQGSRH